MSGSASSWFPETGTDAQYLRIRQELLAATEVFEHVRPGHHAVLHMGGTGSVRVLGVHSAALLVRCSPYMQTVGGRLLGSGLDGSLYGGLVALGLRGALLAGPKVVDASRQAGPKRQPATRHKATRGHLLTPWVCGAETPGDENKVVQALEMAGKYGTVVCSISKAKWDLDPYVDDGWSVPVYGMKPPSSRNGLGIETQGGSVKVFAAPLVEVSKDWQDVAFVVAPWVTKKVRQSLGEGVVLWEYGRHVDLADDLRIVTGCGDWQMSPDGQVWSSGGRFSGVSQKSGGGRWAVLGVGGDLAVRKRRAQALLDLGSGTTKGMQERAAAMMGGLVVLPVASDGSLGGQKDTGDTAERLARGVAALSGGVIVDFWSRDFEGAGVVPTALRYIQRVCGFQDGEVFVASGLDDLVARVSGLYSMVTSVGAVVSDREPWRHTEYE